MQIEKQVTSENSSKSAGDQKKREKKELWQNAINKIKQQKLQSLQAPVGQGKTVNLVQKKAKLNVRYEFDKEMNKIDKEDVHKNIIVNPFIFSDQSDEINFADPQVQNYMKEVSVMNKMGLKESEDFFKEYELKQIKIKKNNDLIENYQIEAFMSALLDERHFIVLEKICVQFRIQDVCEFNLERLSQQFNENSSFKKIFQDFNQTYQLFKNEQYLISKMNPFQLALVFNNLQALRYMTVRLNCNLRISLNAPDQMFHGLMIKHSNQVKKECWPLFVAINNQNLKMLMFLWQDIGNKYNVSAATGYGNLNSTDIIRLGQDKQLTKKGFNKILNIIQAPRTPSYQQQIFNGNDNFSKLWAKDHFLEIIEVLIQQKYIDGLKFILSCKASHLIYKSMTIKEKLYFIHYFSLKFNETAQDEIKEILIMKFTEKPYASLFIFVMIHIDKSVFENLQNNKIANQNDDFKSFRGSTFKNESSFYQVRQSEVYVKILKSVQNGDEHLDQMLNSFNKNLVHLEYSLKNIEAQEIIRFKYEFQQFDSFALKNLDFIIKISRKKNPIFFEIAKKIKESVNDILENYEKQQEFNFSFFSEIKKSLKSLMYEQNLRQNWSDYQIITNRNLFYWAKTGDLENFEQSVKRFQISTFNRIKIKFRKSQQKRQTLVNYHDDLKYNEADDRSSLDSFDRIVKNEEDQENFEIEIAQTQKSRKKKMIFLDIDRFRNEYILNDLYCDSELFDNGQIYAELTPLLVAIQYKHFEIVRFIMEKINVDRRMNITLITSKKQQNQLSIEKRNPFERPIRFSDQNEYKTSYGLLIACQNEDIKILSYLWENYCTFFWSLSEFKCVMEQLISQSWFQGINFILQSEVTHQLIKAQSSSDRSRLIQDFIAQPFQAHHDAQLKKCLIFNFCQSPYAGSFIILLIEHFQLLQGLEPDSNQCKQLGSNQQNSQELFEEIWNSCLKGLYPLEIQILKETCHERFMNFIQHVERIDLKQMTIVSSQAIKIVQLLKSCSNYKAIFEEVEPLSEDNEDSKFIDEYQTNENILIGKQISVQTFKFERGLKLLESFHQDILRQIINGNLQQIQDIVHIHKIDASDLAQMRGFCFNIKYSYFSKKTNKMKIYNLNTTNWNPIHFSVFFKQTNILRYFNSIFKNTIDISCFLQSERRLSNQSIEGFIQDNHNEDTEIEQILKDCPNLENYTLSILAQSIENLNFFLVQSEHGVSINLKQIQILINLCETIQWNEGAYVLLKSQLCNNQFIMSALNDKVDFIENLFHSMNSLQTDDKASYNQIYSLVFNFPYVSVVQIVLNNYSFNKKHQFVLRIKTDIKNNFKEKTIQMLDSVVQIKQMLDLQSDQWQNIKENQKISINQINNNKDLPELSKNQELQDIDLQMKFNEQIYSIQKYVQNQISSYSQLTSQDDMQKLCTELVEKILFSQNFDPAKMLKDFEEMLVSEGVIYLQTLNGFQYKNFKNLPENLRQVVDKVEGIPIVYLNCLHWVILSNQNDIFNYVMNNYFKAGSKTDQYYENASSDSIFLEPQIFKICLFGNIPTYSIKMIKMLSQKKYDKDYELLSEKRNHYTIQLEGGDFQDCGIDFSEEVKEKRECNLQIQIENISLVLIILSNNQYALQQIIENFPTIFNQAINDVPSALLFMALKQQSEMIDMLLPFFQPIFSQYSLMSKFLYVQKIMNILKFYKSKQVQEGCLRILQVQQVNSFIQWISLNDANLKNQDHQNILDIVIFLYCREHFSKDEKQKLKAFQSQQIDDSDLLDLHEELNQLQIYEKSIFNQNKALMNNLKSKILMNDQKKDEKMYNQMFISFCEIYLMINLQKDEEDSFKTDKSE